MVTLALHLVRPLLVAVVVVLGETATVKTVVLVVVVLK
jgi:hypothetical protein